jgi:hypothetical protein
MKHKTRCILDGHTDKNGILKAVRNEGAKRKKYENRKGNSFATGRARGRRDDGSVSLS